MMTKYEVTAVSARINSGVLELTKEQAAARLHSLKLVKSNNYEVLRTVEFKRGEVIGYKGDLPKVLASVLEAGSDNTGSDISVSDLKKKLKDLNVDFPSKANKTKLQELLAEAEKKVAEDNAFMEKAKADYEGSESLQQDFDTFEDYFESLEQK